MILGNSNLTKIRISDPDDVGSAPRPTSSPFIPPTANKVRMGSINPIAIKNQLALSNLQNVGQLQTLSDVKIDQLVTGAVPQYDESDNKFHVRLGIPTADQGFF